MITKKPDTPEVDQQSSGSGRPNASIARGVPHERRDSGAPDQGKEKASSDKDRPINISTADDVDIDPNSPDRDDVERKP